MIFDAIVHYEEKTMIGPEEIHNLLNNEPFQPFRIYMKAGSHHDILRAFNNVPARSYMAIGIPRADDPDPNPIAERSIKVPYAEMDRIEFLATPSTTQRA
jgi:hypothetical protein